MKKYLYAVVAAAMIFVLGSTPFHVYASAVNVKPEVGRNCRELYAKLRDEKRKLWSDHVLWTRSFIVSDLAELEDKDVVLQRLLKNQEDIGNTIKPYYGEEKGNQLTDLLKEHIAIAGKVVDAAKVGNKEELDKNNMLWYKNADDISRFLNSINPNWETKVVQDIFYKHLQLITEQLVARIGENWQADVQAYDEGADHMLMLADLLASGIVMQFPNKCTYLIKE